MADRTAVVDFHFFPLQHYPIRKHSLLPIYALKEEAKKLWNFSKNILHYWYKIYYVITYDTIS